MLEPMPGEQLQVDAVRVLMVWLVIPSGMCSAACSLAWGPEQKNPPRQTAICMWRELASLVGFADCLFLDQEHGFVGLPLHDSFCLRGRCLCFGCSIVGRHAENQPSFLSGS